MQAKQASDIKVIDVSKWQDKIDWKVVKVNGVQGVFIKATEGASRVDLKLSSHAEGAQRVGMPYGLYHYAHPNLNDPLKEAACFVATVKLYKPVFPHVLDVEGEEMAKKVGAEKLTAWCVAWLQEVERLTGHPAMIYTGASFARSYLGKKLAKWPLWVAHYGVEQPMSNSTWQQWAVFQYTDIGHIDGISGNVDTDAMERVFYDKYVHPNVPQPLGEDNIPVIVNDNLVAYGRVIDGHVYLPLRPLGDALGAKVHWDASAATAYLNGKAVGGFKLREGRTYIGVRVAAVMLGGNVAWDGQTKKVYFNK
ncbi:GH25 family lysozyme [Paenibacillus sp. OV219]|uniref:GH25 family lysozyme n=1 Tax=Paenibacillus sp. OV219 TaxID=1884377 RepID=UPI0008CEB012|nr:GH25 family lysozyme [Paenibacillus sp. OV219]SEM82231.1 lysozyme [Paenibacillus sp. OV219]